MKLKLKEGIEPSEAERALDGLAEVFKENGYNFSYCIGDCKYIVAIEKNERDVTGEEKVREPFYAHFKIVE